MASGTAARANNSKGVIECFTRKCAGDEDLVEVSVQGKDATYLRTQLNKRIDARNVKGVARATFQRE
jgi:hypothetical protein